jgi:hypothetical protein
MQTSSFTVCEKLKMLGEVRQTQEHNMSRKLGVREIHETEERNFSIELWLLAGLLLAHGKFPG